MTDIFISYSRADRDRVETLARALEEAGFKVWWDNDLPGGVEYSREIESRILAARAVVVLWSASSIESTWVADEAELARDEGKLVPMLIDDVQPKMGFRQFQAIDFRHWAGDVDDTTFSALLTALRRHGVPAGTPAAGAPQIPPGTGAGTGPRDEHTAFDIAALQVARPALTPLVGRTDEQGLIAAHLESARSGRGGLLLIGGEPGVGKTRLAEECLAGGQDLGMLTLVGHAYEERGEPFIVAVEIIEELLRILPDPVLEGVLGDSGAEVARLVPALRDRFSGLPPPLDLAPEQQQRYLFNAVLDMTRRLGATVPCVLLLDDLHWADDSSMALIEHMVPHIANLPVLFVITYRDVAADMGQPFRRALAAFNRLPSASKMHLKQLAVDDVASLLAILGGQNPPDNLVKVIFEESGGNALYVQSVYQSLAEENRLFDEDGVWRSDITRDDLVVPDDIRLVIERRVERLDEITRALLVMAAVLGQRFEPDVLEAALDSNDEAVLDAIEEAEAANLVHPASGVRDSRYEFSHALVRQSLLDMTTPLRRERLHYMAASAIEALYGDDSARAASLARHMLGAGRRIERRKTFQTLMQAAAYSANASSFDEAIAHYDNALGLLTASDAHDRSEVLAQRGYANRALGDWGQSERDWLDAVALMETDGDPERIAQLTWEVAFQLVWQNRLAEGTDLLERTLAQIDDTPGQGRAKLLALLGHFLTNSGQLEEGDALQRQAIEMADTIEDSRLLASDIMFSRLYHFQHTFQTGAYLAGIDETIELQKAHRGGPEFSRPLGSAIVACICAGAFDRVRAISEEVMPLALATGDAGTVAQTNLFGGMVDTAEGRFAEARTRMHGAVNIYRETGMPWESAALAAAVGPVILMGDWDAARTETERAVDIAVDCPTFDGYEKAQLLYLRTLMGDDRALSLLDEYEALLPIQGRLNGLGSWHMLTVWIECAASLEQHARAAPLYGLAADLLEDRSVTTYFPVLIERIAGIAALCGDRFDLAEAHFDAALDQARELPFVSELGEIRRWRALMLLRRNAPRDRRQARELLQEAIAQYAHHGMPRHRVMAESILQQVD